MNKKYFYLIPMAILLSCGASAPKEIPVEATLEKPADEILFVLFKMSKTNSTNTIVLTSTHIGKGKMKPEIDRPIHSGNYLTVEIYQDEKRTNIRHIEHPLLKNVEYLNENNQFSTKSVALDEAEFFIRLQKKGSTKIKISETINNQPSNQWQTFTLTP